MNIKKMIISIIVIMILINITFLPKTLAISDIIEEGDDFLNSGGSEEEVVNKTKIKEVSSKIYNILLACGIGVAVIVGAVLGITFILSSAEGKAKVSETLVPYIIGCFVVFGAFAIWKVVINIGNNIENNALQNFEEQYSNEDIRRYEFVSNKYLIGGDNSYKDEYEELKKQLTERYEYVKKKYNVDGYEEYKAEYEKLKSVLGK